MRLELHVFVDLSRIVDKACQDFYLFLPVNTYSKESPYGDDARGLHATRAAKLVVACPPVATPTVEVSNPGGMDRDMTSTKCFLMLLLPSGNLT